MLVRGMAWAVVISALAALGRAQKPRPWHVVPKHAWSDNLPADGRYGHSMVQGPDDALYSFGGKDEGADRIVADLVRFDGRTLNFALISPVASAPAPSARYFHAMCALGDRIYVHGGTTQVLPGTSDLWSLSIPSLEWLRLDAGTGLSLARGGGRGGGRACASSFE
jgi:hypothetical protein